MDDLLIRTGHLLRRRRTRAGLTLRELSSRCGVAVPQLSRIENGQVDLRLSTLVRILDATHGSIADVAIEPVSVTPVGEVLRRRTVNRARLESVGISPSDPGARLDEREGRGDDVDAERKALW